MDGNSQSVSKFPEKIYRFSRDGLEWVYEFTLPIEGIILKGSQLQNKFIVAIISIVFSIMAFYLFPLRTSMRE